MASVVHSRWSDTDLSSGWYHGTLFSSDISRHLHKLSLPTNDSGHGPQKMLKILVYLWVLCPSLQGTSLTSLYIYLIRYTTPQACSA